MVTRFFSLWATRVLLLCSVMILRSIVGPERTDSNSTVCGQLKQIDRTIFVNFTNILDWLGAVKQDHRNEVRVHCKWSQWNRISKWDDEVYYKFRWIALDNYCVYSQDSFLLSHPVALFWSLRSHVRLSSASFVLFIFDEAVVRSTREQNH